MIIMLIDIHAHYSYYQQNANLVGRTLLSAHYLDEMDALMNSMDQPLLYRSMGVHPQGVNMQLLNYLERFIANSLWRNKLDAIGEIGFDLWPEFRGTLSLQRLIFEKQIDLAIEHALPVVIHQRKAMNHIFFYIHKLKRVPAVIFHAYSGTLVEAISLRKKGVNAYFSVGTPLLWGSKIAKELVINLPLSWLFLESDAPFQPQRGQNVTTWSDLILVYEAVATLRAVDPIELENTLNDNFNNVIKQR